MTHAQVGCVAIVLMNGITGYRIIVHTDKSTTSKGDSITTTKDFNKVIESQVIAIIYISMLSPSS